MAPAKTAPRGTMKPPRAGVKVRTYNVGFGDCHLLAFPAGKEGAFYMLIDCGVHHQYPGGSQRLRKVVEDIIVSTGSRLHVVVATHEHTDHLLGFKYCQDLFSRIDIDELWLGWPEDPDDPLAQSLELHHGKKVKTLAAAAERLGAASPRLAMQVQALLEFEAPALLGASGEKKNELNFLREQSKKKLLASRDYRHPEDPPLVLPGVKGVKVFVLGPPRDVRRIKQLETESEMYLGALGSALPAAGGGDDEQGYWLMQNCPFDGLFCIPREQAASHQEYGRFYQEFYGLDGTSGAPAWRWIENDWLGVAEDLALSINRLTNNTSLALAIELAGDRVLLFAADAQVGNWLSWSELEWENAGPHGETVRGADLLKRVTLYKVGHHGSRNATLKQKGLEIMSASELIALIPVDEAWAKDGGKNWEHPDSRLLERIHEKTKGRLIRTDQIPPGKEPPTNPGLVTEVQWKQFTKKLNWDQGPDRLWIEYTVGTG